MSDRLTALIADPSFENEFAQIRTKALLKEVTGVIPEFQWRYSSSRLIRNAVAGLVDLQTTVAVIPKLSSIDQNAARRLAQLWESMSRLEEHTSRATALMNAAVLYELAGYQANAISLSRRLLPILQEQGSSDIIELAALFFQRKFHAAANQAETLSQQPPPADAVIRDLSRHIATAVAAAAIRSSSLYFLTGEEDLFEEAIRRFDLADRGFVESGVADASNLVRAFRTVLPVMRTRSTWELLAPVLPSNQRWLRYIRLLARGLDSSVSNASSVSELWPSQIAALDGGLLSDLTSKVVRMPTSAGKTRVAEMAIIHHLIDNPGSISLYIAPFRALAFEVESTLSSILPDLGFRVSSIIGSYETDQVEEQLIIDTDVLVLTPEKFDLIARVYPEVIERIGLIVLDEGHVITDLSRGTKYELLLSRMKRRVPTARFLMLSAVIPETTLRELSIWLSGNPDHILESEWRPAVQRLAGFRWLGVMGRLDFVQDSDIIELEQFVPNIIQQHTYTFVNPKTQRVNTKKFPSPTNKSQTAAELALRLSDLGPVLVFCTQPRWVESVGNALRERFRYMRASDQPVPGEFITDASHAAIVASEWFGEDHDVSRCLASGIGLHHSGLPDAVKRAVEDDFRNRKLPILVATSTLAQGVNLPIRTVIVHSCSQYSDEDPHAIISARDYWNIAGRAGRAREETEGMIVHLINNPSDLSNFVSYVERRKQLEPVESALFRLLMQLIEGRLSPEAVADRLEVDVLAWLVEESVNEVTDDWIESILSGTLAAQQSSLRDIEIAPLASAVRLAAIRILEAIPESRKRHVCSSTGLSTQSYLRLRDFILNSADVVRFHLASDEANDVFELAGLLLSACGDLDEMQPSRAFPGDYDDLLRLWLAGNNVSSIRASLEDTEYSNEELGRFIEDLFGYRLPWGISGFLRIAVDELGIIDEDLTVLARSMPALVKNGLPFPEAAWAASIGVTVREVAIELGNRYRQEGEVESYNTFLDWIATFDIRSLESTFGLPPGLVRQVSQALTGARRNLYLDKFDGLDNHLPLVFPLTDTISTVRSGVSAKLIVGARVDIERDFMDALDRNALKIVFQGQLLGYAPRRVSQLIAPEIDSGMRFAGSIVSGTQPGTPRIYISVDRLTKG